MPRSPLGKYRLEGKQPIHERDLLAWCKWFETADRIVAQTQIGDVAMVSTVFLGIDHNWSGRGAPVLFETMTFEMHGAAMVSADGLSQDRYTTWEKAEAGHARVVEHMKEMLAAAPVPAAPVRKGE